MKTILRLTVLLTILFGISASAQAAKPAPRIVFKETSHDFGNIREEAGPVTQVFEFTNEGDTPLVIISAKATCGCTRPTYSPEPVKPGQSGRISVKYLTKGRPGEFDKTIKIRTNDPKAKTVNLRISGTVIPAK